MYPDLHYIILFIVAIVFLTVCSLLILSLIRIQGETGESTEAVPNFRSSRLLEAVWTIIPVGILILLLVLTFQTIQAENSFHYQVSTTAEKQPEHLKQGELLFYANCAGCHTLHGQGGQVGPELTNIYTEKNEAYLHESILRPEAVIAAACPGGLCPTGVMPQNFDQRLSQRELTRIIAYLKGTAETQ